MLCDACSRSFQDPLGLELENIHTTWCGVKLYEVNIHRQQAQITTPTEGIMLRLNPHQHVKAF